MLRWNQPSENAGTNFYPSPFLASKRRLKEETSKQQILFVQISSNRTGRRQITVLHMQKIGALKSSLPIMYVMGTNVLQRTLSQPIFKQIKNNKTKIYQKVRP